MFDDETIVEFNVGLCKITNKYFYLTEKMSEEKLVRNILRSLSKRFYMKLTAIEEIQDVSTIKVDKLFGSLLNFEMSIKDKNENKNN